MSDFALTEVAGRFLGASCRLERGKASTWFFIFQNIGTLSVESHWRLLDQGLVAVVGNDDGHLFGLPEPCDCEKQANALLTSAKVIEFQSVQVPADLRVTFDNGIQLEAFTASVGYESWQIGLHGGGTIIGMGGGRLETFWE